jgi:Amt family ammonium transporter
MISTGSSTSTNAYGTCSVQLGENSSAKELLECVSDYLQNQEAPFSSTLVLTFAGAIVFLMQAGFAMVCAGAVRTKNVQNAMLKNLLDACGASLAFFSIGYALGFGGMEPESSKKTFVGHSQFFLMDVDDYAFWLFQYAFSAASATIVAGTLAERCQMTAYLCYSLMLTGWVYPVILHSIWNPNGWLSAYSVDPLWGSGLVDFAGSGVVHVTGGITALFATMVLGPRRGRFHDDLGHDLARPREFQAHSPALQMLGTFILWFGFYGFNIGSALISTKQGSDEAAALAGVNTTLSGSAAGIVALFLNLWYLEKTTGEPLFDLKYAMNGAICGLVAISGGCGVFEPWAAVVTGAVAGVIYLLGSRGLVSMRLDDAVDAIPVHLCGGAWGILAVGLFAAPERLLSVYGRNNHPGLVYSIREGDIDGVLFGIQLIGLMFIMGWVMIIMLPFFVWLNWKGWFRSDPLEEILGLDLSYHVGLALHTNNVHPEYVGSEKDVVDEIISTRQRKVNGSTTTKATSGTEELEYIPEVSDEDLSEMKEECL